MAIKAGKVRKRRRLPLGSSSISSSQPHRRCLQPHCRCFQALRRCLRRYSQRSSLQHRYIDLQVHQTLPECLTKKGDFTEKKLSTPMLSGDVGIGETVKLLEGRKTGGDFSSPKSTNIRSIAKSKKNK